MIDVRKATVSDLNNLLDVIFGMNEAERYYLRYDEESRGLRRRLLKNIKEDHLVLFLDDNEPFGFIEYTVKNNALVWVYSLYFKKEYRNKTFKLLTPLFVGMKHSYRLPIHFTIRPENKAMQLIVKFIRAEPVAEYVDGRIEYCVKECVS